MELAYASGSGRELVEQAPRVRVTAASRPQDKEERAFSKRRNVLHFIPHLTICSTLCGGCSSAHQMLTLSIIADDVDGVNIEKCRNFGILSASQFFWGGAALAYARRLATTVRTSRSDACSMRGRGTPIRSSMAIMVKPWTADQAVSVAIISSSLR